MHEETEALINELNKTMGGQVLQVASKLEKRKLRRTGTLTLDVALGGGYPVGGLVELWGHKNGGKSTLCLLAVAEAQRNDEDCIYIDSERSFNPDWAEMLGVDLSRLYLLTSLTDKDDNPVPFYMEQVFDMLTTMLERGGAGIIVLDSLPALIPQDEYGKTFTDSQRVGGMAGPFTRFLSKTVGSGILEASNSTLFVVNQIRANINAGLYGPKESHTGGHALAHYALQQLEVRASTADVIKDKGGAIEETRRSNVMLVQVQKNKVTGPQFRKARLNIYYDRGIDRIEDVLQVAEYLHIIDRAGPWYKYGDQKWKGSNELYQALSDTSLLNEVREKTLQAAGL